MTKKSTKKRSAYLALGSNLGNRKAYLRGAILNLVDVVGVSQLYETDPVGYDDQGPFLNLVVELQTELSPRQLLEICQAQEELAQRQRNVVNGPRTLDLDVLWVEGEEVNEPDLNVPHPQMFERGFVMVPLSDLNQDIPAEWLAKNLEADGTCPGVRNVGSLNLKPPEQPPILTTNKSISRAMSEFRNSNQKIGLVPTMGALHAGHLSLIQRSKQENDITLMTSFVNPLQFNEAKDFESYPKDMERDLETLEAASPDLIFAPDEREIYPTPVLTNIALEPLTSILEGEFRPGHLEGVCIVVAKLFNIVGPCSAYFGEKDYQQLQIVSRLVKDLHMPINIVACPIVRDSDGLALSSRNALLDPPQRQAALKLSEALNSAQQLIQNGETSASKVIDHVSQLITQTQTQSQTRTQTQAKINLEYVSIRAAADFEPVETIDAPVRILIAAKIDNIRLIDNIHIAW